MQLEGINYKFLKKELLKEYKPLIIFLHEGLGSITQWRNFPEELCDFLNLPALIYDRTGYGKSKFWSKNPDAEFLHKEADFLNNFIDELKIKNDIIIFGHSDGATIALINASKPHPKIKAVIAEAPHVILEEISYSGIISARKMLEKPIMIEKMNNHHYGRAEKLIDIWTQLWLDQKETNWNILKELQKIKIPLCLIQGDKDNFGSFKQLDTVSENVKSKIIESHKLENCGHIPHFDKTEILLKITEIFINKIET